MKELEKRKIQEAAATATAIEKLVANRDRNKINELLSRNEINEFILANVVYKIHKSFDFFNELNISTKQLAFIIQDAFIDIQLVRLFLTEVLNIDFNSLINEAINFGTFKTKHVVEIAIAAKNSGNGSSVLLLTDKIINTNNAKDILAFLKVVTGIEGARIDDLINAFIKETKAIKNGIIEKYDWTRITDVVETINEFVNWAINQKDISLNEISQKVIATNKPEYIFVFLKSLIGVENAPINDLIQALINIGNVKCVYPLIKEHKNLSQESLYKIFELFIENVKKAYAPLPLEIERDLAYYTVAELFDDISLGIFINYWNSKEYSPILTKSGVDATILKIFTNHLDSERFSTIVEEKGIEVAVEGIKPFIDYLDSKGYLPDTSSEKDYSFSVQDVWRELQNQFENNSGGNQYQLVKPNENE